MKKSMRYRLCFYIIGLLTLAMGLILNTKAGLGVSPIISVSYSISEISHSNFGDMTLILYCLFVLIEIVLHLMQKREKFVLILDLLQIPLSIVFTRFLNLFSSLLPEFSSEPHRNPTQWILRLLVLLLALLLTGIGAAMSLNMRIVPNPGDGIVQAIADTIHKSVGFTKNCFDLFNVLLTITVSLVFSGRLHGVGIGTLLAVIGVGRVIAFFNHFTKDFLLQTAGLTE